MGFFRKKKKEEAQLPVFQAQQPSSAPFAADEKLDKDLALIQSKLDLINARLENLHQRLANLERIAYEEQKRQW